MTHNNYGYVGESFWMNVDVLPMSRKHAAGIIHEIITDSHRVIMPHVEEMGPWKKVITDRQIRLCLEAGAIVDGPKLDGVGEFECTLYRVSAGVEVWVRIGVYRKERTSPFELFVKEVITKP